MYVQYGCGFSAPKEWQNFDCSPTLRIERLPIIGLFLKKNQQKFPDNVRYGNIVQGLPIQAESCQAIYCSHVLEHLSYHDLHTALMNTFTYLKIGGIFRAVVPDLHILATSYLQNKDSNSANIFMEDSGLGQPHRPRTIKEFLIEWFGNSQHRWLWDEASLSEALRKVGFNQIRRAHYGDSQDKMFSLVEDSARFKNALALECIK